MSSIDLYTATIIVSVALFVAVGSYSGRKVKELDDYFVAGRRAPTFLIVGTLVASVFSTSIFLGEAAFTYDGQMGAYILLPGIAVAGYVYGALLFGTYLWEQFGDAFITDLVADTNHGVASLDPMITAADSGADFDSVLGDFALAVALDDPEFEAGQFGFDEIDFIAVDVTLLEQDSPASVSVPAEGGATFIRSFDNADGLTLRLQTDSADDLEVRVATSTSSGGVALLADALDGATTDVSIGTWPTGTSVWVTVTNSSATAATLDASLL